jgi:hypothetical protein
VYAPNEDKCNDINNSFYKELEQVIDQFPKYLKILSWDIYTKVEKEDIFTPPIRNESSHETSNDNGV